MDWEKELYPENENPLDNKPTFAGYYGAIIQRYKEISPDSKFFFVTLPKTDTPERADKEKAMRELMYSLADKFDNSYVIDLYKYGPVYDKKFEEKFFMYYHMNPSGYIFTARIIDSYIDYIVRHNPKDFETVAFIGTDIEYK